MGVVGKGKKRKGEEKGSGREGRERKGGREICHIQSINFFI